MIHNVYTSPFFFFYHDIVGFPSVRIATTVTHQREGFTFTEQRGCPLSVFKSLLCNLLITKLLN